jgi:TRAP-type C4-dicarboxylate transport system substrate-binding protein
MKNEKKTIMCIIIFLAFLLSCFATAYAQSSTKPMEIKVATWNPPHIAPSKIVVKWAKMVEERSGGKVKFVFYWASALAKLPDTFRATQTGIADMGMWVIGAVSGLTPLNEYISLPFMGFKDSPTVLKVFREMRKKMPVLDAEFKGLKYLYAYPMPPYQFHTTKKTIRVPGDLRGMKLLADASSTDFLKALGAVTVTKGPPDWYMSLQKGLVEAQLNHWAVVNAFKLEELFSQHTEVGLAGANSLMLGWWMNQDSWNKLPPEAQKAIIDIQPAIEEESLNMSLHLQKLGQEGAKKAGHEIIKLSPEEVEVWAKATASAREKWVASMEAKGKPGKAVYDEAQRLIAHFNK